MQKGLHGKYVCLNHCSGKSSNRDPCKNTSCKIRHGGSIYSVLNYSIFLMPRFTGMRDGAGSAGFAGSGGGGAGLSLVMIASRW